MKCLFVAAAAVGLIGLVSPAAALPLTQAAPTVTADDSGIVLVRHYRSRHAYYGRRTRYIQRSYGDDGYYARRSYGYYGGGPQYYGGNGYYGGGPQYYGGGGPSIGFSFGRGGW